ncbi:MAG: hypothetical protein CM1200mP3_07190 [Chloroflexota bacterium]|nr:MAG: hypothetical protein CM1200mP3_07190 [Chloroflexota bacterium]
MGKAGPQCGEKTITDTAVISAVSEHFGIATDQIRGKGRRKMTVLSRQVAMYLLREETDLSFTAMGKNIGRPRPFHSATWSRKSFSQN